MEDGYYWYISGPGDYGDLEDEEPQIVRVCNGGVETCGGDLSYTLEETHGTFKEPIKPPEF